MKFLKRLFKGFYMSLGMFCAIPLPVNIWDDDCANLMMPCMPVIGILLGALWWGLGELLLFLGLNLLLISAVMTVFPFIITGLLHLDGYMDTNDAILSRRPLEDKLRILKDPHTGAFSVIALVILFILQFPATYSAIANNRGFLILFMIIPVVSRCCSGFAVLTVPVMAQSGYANLFRKNVHMPHRLFIVLLLIITYAVSFIFAHLTGIIIVFAVVLGYVCAMAYAYKEFKGISGDLAGYAIVISELCGIFALAVFY